MTAPRLRSLLAVESTRRDSLASHDGFYNPVRRHSYLGYNNPIEFESEVAILAASSDCP